MQELNARVDLDKEEPADVAADYLSEFGLRRVVARPRATRICSHGDGSPRFTHARGAPASF